MQIQNLIGPDWPGRVGRRPFPVIDPATDEVIAEVPAGGAADTRAAIEAAEAALDDWRSRPAGERSALLRRFNDLMVARQEELAQLMTREQGKPLAEARGESAVRRLLHGMGGRGSQARVRRDDTRLAPRQAHPHPAPAGRRDRLHHAVELPVGDDHAQAGPGARRRLHDGDQAGRPDAALGAGARRARARSRHSARRGQHRDRRFARHRRRAAVESDRAQALVHRVDRSRQDPDDEGRRRTSHVSRSSSAATRRSSCSTMPTSRPAWPAR